MPNTNPLTTAAESLKALRELENATEAARTAAAEAIRTARSAGFSVSDLVEVTGESRGVIDYFERRDTPVAEEYIERSKRYRPSVKKNLPGMGATEAAKHLGISLAAIYKRKNAGTITHRVIEGRLRFFPDGDPPPPADSLLPAP